MTTITNDTRTSGQPSAACQVDIRIESQGDVHIYTCTAPGPSAQPCPPQATGACVPLALGAKPKQSRQRKLQKLLANNRVPSALATSFFHLSRRFLAGHSPANPLEESAFGVLRSLSPEVKSVLFCAVSSLDALGSGERDRLFDGTLPRDPGVPIAPDTLATAVGEELAQRVSELIFDDPGAVEVERPGKNRFFKPTGEFFEPQQRISPVNGLRTNEFKPALAPGDFEPAELQQH